MTWSSDLGVMWTFWEGKKVFYKNWMCPSSTQMMRSLLLTHFADLQSTLWRIKWHLKCKKLWLATSSWMAVLRPKAAIMKCAISISQCHMHHPQRSTTRRSREITASLQWGIKSQGTEHSRQGRQAIPQYLWGNSGGWTKLLKKNEYFKMGQRSRRYSSKGDQAVNIQV